MTELPATTDEPTQPPPEAHPEHDQDTRPVVYGYLRMVEPNDSLIRHMQIKLYEHCLEHSYYLATIFCDRGALATQHAPGFRGLLDAVAAQSRHTTVTVLILDAGQLDDDEAEQRLCKYAIARQGGQLAVVSKDTGSSSNEAAAS